jgi:hypothetical protein
MDNKCVKLLHLGECSKCKHVLPNKQMHSLSLVIMQKIGQQGGVEPPTQVTVGTVTWGPTTVILSRFTKSSMSCKQQEGSGACTCRCRWVWDTT